MYGNPEGRRPRGRPKVRWWNQVKADMEKVGASEEDAEDRSRWRSFVGAAKYHLRYKWPWENQSAKLRAENNQVRSLSYDLMQSQLWALLPSFCTQPSDIAVSFAVIAKPLGSLLSNQKDQRLSVMSALRHLVTYARDNNRTQDVSELARFAKNYLPILFNLYTTPVKGSDEEGIRLATLETVKELALHLWYSVKHAKHSPG
ncbi:pre-rRNA processing protein [Homalodisca vitripennis]|nr:pre-rRNA processing protein [Homalodisca vitripennis]